MRHFALLDPDPDSITSVDPYPNLNSESASTATLPFSLACDFGPARGGGGRSVFYAVPAPYSPCWNPRVSAAARRACAVRPARHAIPAKQLITVPQLAIFDQENKK